MVAVLATVVLLCPIVFVMVKGHRSVGQGEALVVTQLDRVRVSFSGRFVLPWLHGVERVDLRSKTIRVDRRGKDALSCRDGIRVDLVAEFRVHVNATAEDVLKVAQNFGAARTSDQAAIEELFVTKFASELVSTAKHYDFEYLDEERNKFRQEVIDVIGADLGGYVLDDVVIVSLTQAPIEVHDPDNILDARGIQKIRELTLERQLRTAERESQCKEMLIRLERIEAEAMRSYTESTGRELRKEQLETRLKEHLREMIREEIDA